MLQRTLAVARVAKTLWHDEGVKVKVVRSLLSWLGIFRVVDFHVFFVPLPYNCKKSGSVSSEPDQTAMNGNEIGKKFGKSRTYQESLYTCSDKSPLLYAEGKGRSASAGKWS